MKIIIDTESEKKEALRKQKEEALRKQKEEALHEQSSEFTEIACDPMFLIPTTIIIFILFWVSPLGDACRKILANGG